MIDAMYIRFLTIFFLVTTHFCLCAKNIKQQDLFLQGKNLYVRRYQFQSETWPGKDELCGKKTCLYRGWFLCKNRYWLIKNCRDAEEVANELFVSRFGLQNGVSVQMAFPERNSATGAMNERGLCIAMAPSSYRSLADFLRHDNGSYHHYFGESDWRGRVIAGILYWFDAYETKNRMKLDETCLLKIIAMQLFLGCQDCHAHNILVNSVTNTLLKIDNGLIGEPRTSRLNSTKKMCLPLEKRLMTKLTDSQKERFKLLRSYLVRFKRDNSISDLERLYMNCFDALNAQAPCDITRGLNTILAAHQRVDYIVADIEHLLGLRKKKL